MAAAEAGSGTPLIGDADPYEEGTGFLKGEFVKRFWEILSSKQPGTHFVITFVTKDVPPFNPSETVTWNGVLESSKRAGMFVHFNGEAEATPVPEWLEHNIQIAGFKAMNFTHKVLQRHNDEPNTCSKRGRLEPGALEIAKAMDLRDAGGVWKSIAEGVKVPCDEDERFAIFYPHLWQGKVDDGAEWHEAFREFCLTHSVQFKSMAKLQEAEFFKHTFVLYTHRNFNIEVKDTEPLAVKCTPFVPQTKNDFRQMFYCSASLFGLVALASPMGRPDGFEAVMESFESGKIDFAKLWVTKKTASNQGEEFTAMNKRLASIEAESKKRAEATSSSSALSPQASHTYVYVPSFQPRGRGKYRGARSGGRGWQHGPR